MDNRSEILDRLDRGEISAQAALRALSGAAEPEAEAPRLPSPTDPSAPAVLTAPEGPAVLTRRERLLALTERVRDWDPRHMVTLTPSPRAWPWPDQPYQWFWQDFDHPVHVDHTLDLADGCGLFAVLYEGDLTLTGGEGRALKIGAAAFDLRIGRDASAARIAGATGALDLSVPDTVSRIDAKVLPGDLSIRDLRAQKVCVECESGDLRCEGLRAGVEAQVRGGDANLFGIEGEIAVTAAQGNIRCREIRSTQVHLVAHGGISLSLGAVSQGDFRCETRGGDIELFIARDSACALSAEVSDGGVICPAGLPWTDLSERSGQTLKGTLRGGGASVHLVASGGRVYIAGR
ncbi:MAG: hypothetical protein A3F84_26900 [Candidatus Handelsmanbacteria bacterium RIFCSPLOWO2_12_FULL_64_10]|uniref:DUF4097 domain-containing protein n=1 Tax=Handelsmanbacteria sp. (strain RIFCSPLOWO2_12_FULL_64_10) TaxID=1817868 RepID=A0A1F6CAY4_HANXR|nr:MAG: hypothetical protein A3F84_26900 [Candidatus Handelsmanbacteria bacterium RIFCSPLOWO2_12_FULL_64_10]